MLEKNRELMGFILALALLVTTAWAADALSGQELFSCLVDRGMNSISIGVIVVLSWFGIAYLAYSFRKIFIPIRYLENIHHKPQKCLILIVSKLNEAFVLPPKIAFPLEINKKDRDGHALEGVTLQGLNLHDDIEELNKLAPPFFNWQQTLRAVVPHLETVEKIVLIGSKNGSASQLPMLKKILARYLGDVTIHAIDNYNSVDFSDFVAISDKIRNTIEENTSLLLKNGQTIKEENISVDITGGKAVTSIAAAIATINTRVVFQYVETEITYKKHDIKKQNPIVEVKTHDVQLRSTGPFS